VTTQVTAERATPATRYEAVIGIEVHVRLKTASKMFCDCATDVDEAPPNSRTCPVCLGLPGALPVANRAAVEHVLATGLALEAEIVPATRWDRKNYFYPDLPKGYQISQYELPLTRQGRLTFETGDGPVTVAITRAHLEEDTARLIHGTDGTGRRVSLIDFNRSGLPLMEIVTEPDLRTAEQARRYAEELRLLLRTIGASDAEMENGQMRVEANVSLRTSAAAAFGTRVEVKNMNSFRSVERAIAYEMERQGRLLDAGETLEQETRSWDESRARTFHTRSKEFSEDYRYFPEPDLPPLRPDATWLEAIRARLPELPEARRARYRDTLGLSPYDTGVIVADLGASLLFEDTLAALRERGEDRRVTPKAVANWVTGEYLRLAKSEEARRADAIELADLLVRVADGSLSGTNAKQVFEAHVASGTTTARLVEDFGFAQISDRDALAEAAAEVLAANPQAVRDYRAGKEQALGFLVGQVMRATRGQARAETVRELLVERLRQATP
jgi:aspartyl-tRNA(Asn)/glutamyl-tRNA(Gln) amidotransferase subunit B